MSKQTVTVKAPDGRQLELPLGFGPVLRGEVAPHTDVDKAIHDILGPELSRALHRTFDLMALAEEEIAISELEHPSRAAMIHQTFGALRPTFTMSAYSPQVYRHHCRELINRAIDQWDGKSDKINLSLGTSAELCLMFCEISMIHPLRSIGASIYQHNFVKIFGFNPVAGQEFPSGHGWLAQVVDDLNRWKVWEEWEGQAEEEEGYARAKLSQDWRVMKRAGDVWLPVLR